MPASSSTSARAAGRCCGRFPVPLREHLVGELLHLCDPQPSSWLVLREALRVKVLPVGAFSVFAFRVDRIAAVPTPLDVRGRRQNVAIFLSQSSVVESQLRDPPHRAHRAVADGTEPEKKMPLFRPDDLLCAVDASHDYLGGDKKRHPRGGAVFDRSGKQGAAFGHRREFLAAVVCRLVPGRELLPAHEPMRRKKFNG